MANKSLYNVGIILVGGIKKNLFVGSADGNPFLFVRNSDKFDYVSADALRGLAGLNQAVYDARLDLTTVGNDAKPSYTVDGSGTDLNRQIVVTGITDAQTENYLNQPFFSLKGDGVEAYSATTSLTTSTSTIGMSNAVMANATAAATTPTGIAFVDNAISFVTSNIVLVVGGFVALAFFGIWDPLNLFSKKGKKPRK